MKTTVILSLLAIVGVGTNYIIQETFPSTPIVRHDNQLSALEKARRATCMIGLPTYQSGGSAVLVSRKKLDNDQYQYRALTAYHVIAGMAQDFAKDKVNARHDMVLMFQQRFHGTPTRVKLEIDDIGWTMPFYDWGSFTFTSVYKLECAEVATSEEFEAIQPFERIYMIGYGGLYGQHCRDGIIGTTHNEHWSIEDQMNYGKQPWNKSPQIFFRPYINIWYGDSGGGVFSKDGKLIGLNNGFGIMHNTGFDTIPVTHSAVALKTHVIRDIVKYSKDFFFIEG